MTQADSGGQFSLPTLRPGTNYFRVRRIGYQEASDSVKYGMGGLRLVAVLAPVSLADYACVVPVR